MMIRTTTVLMTALIAAVILPHSATAEELLIRQATLACADNDNGQAAINKGVQLWHDGDSAARRQWVTNVMQTGLCGRLEQGTHVFMDENWRGFAAAKVRVRGWLSQVWVPTGDLCMPSNWSYGIPACTAKDFGGNPATEHAELGPAATAAEPGMWGCISPVVANNFWEAVKDIANRGVEITPIILRQVALKNSCVRIVGDNLRAISTINWSLLISNGTAKGWVSPEYYVLYQNRIQPHSGNGPSSNTR